MGYLGKFRPKPTLSYGLRTSKAHREANRARVKAAVKARKLEEEKGMILDVKRQFRMELKRNTGIGWHRSLQVCKHIEMHKRGPGPPIDQRCGSASQRSATSSSWASEAPCFP